MIVKHTVTVEEKHGQYYARWRSDELITNKHGREVKKQHFEPTYVAVLPPGATKEELRANKQFAEDVGSYMAELVSKKRPAAELQQIKLKEFGLRSAKQRGADESIREFIPLFLIDYAHTEKDGQLPLLMAITNMANTWHQILEELGDDAWLHPSAIPSLTLQDIVDRLPGKQERHVINLRCAYSYGVRHGAVLKGSNPAEDVVIRKVAKVSRLTFEQIAIQRGLHYMASLHNGDQWQLITLCGVYSAMRFITACRLQLMPADFVRPEKPRACSFLNTLKWQIEYYDTKGKKWEVQLLDHKFKTWLIPYIKQHELVSGDFMFPDFARLRSAPSNRWQEIMERSGTKMHYSAKGMCRTGYHALRASQDKWSKENEEVLLTKEDIETGLLRHGARVHRKSYDSGVIHVAQQRRINDSRPAFVGGGSDAEALLSEVREERRKQLQKLHALAAQEAELLTLVTKGDA